MNWKTLKSSYAFICPWLRVRKDHVRLPSGVEMEDFYVVESNDWVNVIAITEDGEGNLEKYKSAKAVIDIALGRGGDQAIIKQDGRYYFFGGRTQELEKQKGTLIGILLIVMGIALQALSHTLGGSDVKDFFSGLLLGLSIAEMLAGIAVIGKSLKRK